MDRMIKRRRKNEILSIFIFKKNVFVCVCVFSYGSSAHIARNKIKIVFQLPGFWRPFVSIMSKSRLEVCRIPHTNIYVYNMYIS